MSYGTRTQNSRSPFEVTIEEVDIMSDLILIGIFRKVRLTIDWDRDDWVINSIAAIGWHSEKKTEHEMLTIDRDHPWFDGTEMEILRWDFNRTAIEDAYQQAVSALSEEEYA
jgi:hypothetical protein